MFYQCLCYSRPTLFNHNNTLKFQLFNKLVVLRIGYLSCFLSLKSSIFYTNQFSCKRENFGKVIQKQKGEMIKSIIRFYNTNGRRVFIVVTENSPPYSTRQCTNYRISFNMIRSLNLFKVFK